MIHLLWMEAGLEGYQFRMVPSIIKSTTDGDPDQVM